MVHNSEIILRDREFCNLSEIIVRESDTMEDLRRKTRLATILGTIQSTLVNFQYISSDWRKNCEEERLLGVSLTGILDNPMLYDYDRDTLTQRQEELRKIAHETNLEWSRTIGINPSAAITCVKPSGCGTLDTKIKTTDGITTFGEIFELCGKDPTALQDGEWVTPPVDLFVFDMNNDKKRITNLYVRGYSPVFEIEDEDGNIYRFSSEHRLLTTNGWKHVRELNVSDEIVSFGFGDTETLNTSVSSQEEPNIEAKS